MKEYPKNVIDAAWRAAGELMLVDGICKAILSERNRCAEIAKRHDTGDMTCEDMEARRIYAEIMKGDAE